MKKRYSIDGMTCTSCEKRIESANSKAGYVVKKERKKSFYKIAGVIAVLGVFFFIIQNTIGFNFITQRSSKVENVASVSGTVQTVNSSVTASGYEPITVKPGVPVKWIINVAAQDLTGCNKSMTIPEYGITKDLAPGKNIIEFTPTKPGTFTYTCWMGMISSTINVVD